MASNPTYAEIAQRVRSVRITFEVMVCSECIAAFRARVQEEIDLELWQEVSPASFELSFKIRPNERTIVRIGELLHRQLNTCFTQHHRT